MLHLIIHSLYTHPEVFLRELISNASDALGKVRFRTLTGEEVLEPKADLKVTLHTDAEAHTLVVEDTGVGMTHADLVERLGTVASSGTLAFVEQLRQSGKPIDDQMIGQFGVGFYAAFMVADEVVVETRHADPEGQGYRWTSDGMGSFTIEEIERPHRGTRILLRLKEEHHDFCEAPRLRHVIEKYSNFVDFPIFIEEEQVNTVKALWHQSKDEVDDEALNAFYKFVSHDWQDPLGHLHLHIEGRVNFHALLFVPKTAPPGLFREDFQQGLHLYSNKVFIQDDCQDLLPDYLRFMRGVVDTEDLPLNVSREVTQASPVMTKIRHILTSKVLGMLKEWAEKDSEKYDAFFGNFGTLFKMGLNADRENREKLVELLRYESTKTETGAVTSLAEYVSRMKEGQDTIYYLLADHREVAERNPNLEYFKKNDLEVLLLVDPVDVFTIASVDKYGEKPVISIEKADLDLKEDAEEKGDSLAEAEANALVERFKAVLGEKVEDVIVSKRLVDSAATLVVGNTGMDAQMERMMKLMNQDYAGARKILEINTAHPLLKNLSALLKADGDDARIEQAVLQLYEGALLIDGNLTTPAAFVARMTELMVDATK